MTSWRRSRTARSRATTSSTSSCHRPTWRRPRLRLLPAGPNGPFSTFVNDGRSPHTFLIHAYDPAAASFEYSDTTGNRSMLEAGNNLAGVEAVRKPDTTSRIWVVKKDQLKTVLSAMIIGEADLLAVGRKIQLGPLGSLGNSPDDAKQTDFFKFFHLEETGKSAGI